MLVLDESEGTAMIAWTDIAAFLAGGLAAYILWRLIEPHIFQKPERPCRQDGELDRDPQ